MCVDCVDLSHFCVVPQRRERKKERKEGRVAGCDVLSALL
jgi:hypothetical protein